MRASESINIRDKFALFNEQWSPRIISEVNDHQFRIVKLQGDFVWHQHEDSDETFIVIHGQMRIDFRDGSVSLSEGDLFTVPKGVEHKPFAENECHAMIVERGDVINTGSAGGERTAENDTWI
ncbi:MAG TPA: cupin domain-containing protein [Fimbriimonas sp.]|nr:cupin domain-containing protein [Fimbriimonas sp.]